MSNNEGWTWLVNSTKWHYFVDGDALCGKWMLLARTGGTLQQGNDTSPDNCMACRRKLEKRLAAKEQSS